VIETAPPNPPMQPTACGAANLGDFHGFWVRRAAADGPAVRRHFASSALQVLKRALRILAKRHLR